MGQVDDKLIGGVPLFAGIERSELEAFLRVFQPVAVAAGATLVRQGQPADGAYIIESGDADVITALPGGGEAAVAKLGPGSVLGEMALLDGGARSATVIARSAVASHFIERDGFRMLLAQRNRAAFTIQNRITRTLCRRLRELNAKIVAADTHGDAAPPLAGASVDPGSVRRGTCSFDYRKFLSLLPVFRRFRAEEIVAFAGRTDVLELERGQILFQQADAGEHAFVVVRGALEILRGENGRRHRIGVLGPGRLCGVLALIEGEAHSMSAAAREPTVLLEIPGTAFDEWFSGNDPVSAKFQDAVNRELLQSLGRANIHLTRLISQARIRGGRREKKQAEELQQALGAQDCRPA